jgi:hypothetical protein
VTNPSPQDPATVPKPSRIGPGDNRGTGSSSHQRRWNTIFIGLLAVIVVLIALWLAHPNADGTSSSTCHKVAATLAEGPNPVANPLGYAKAQVRPLEGIATSNAGLRDAIEQLSAAYERYFSHGGARFAQREVRDATMSLHQYCPGVT